MNAIQTNPTCDYVHLGSYEHELPEDILYCEGDRNYTYVHFVGGRKTFVSTTLGILEARLARRGFKRVNRSYLVNADHVLNYDRDEVTLVNGRILPIARRRRVAVRQWLSALGSSTSKLRKYALSCVFMLLCFAQSAFGQPRIFVAPLLPPDTKYAIPLNYYGYDKNHYSVLVKVRLPGDSIYYTVPGTLPTGDVIGFLHKAGRKEKTDTLYIIHRGGKSAVQLEEIWFRAFHKSDHLMYDRQIFGKPDRDFTRAVITNYYDDRTPRGTLVRGRETRSNEFPLPLLQLTKPSNQYSFRQN